MAIEEGPDGVVVTAPDGQKRSFADLVAELARRSDKPVTKIAEDAGLSRAAFYLIRDKGQQPALLTVASLLTSLGAVVRVPDEEDRPDLQATVGDATFRIEMKKATGETRREKQALRGLLATTHRPSWMNDASFAGAKAVAAPAAESAKAWVSRLASKRGERDAIYRRLQDTLEQLDQDELQQVIDYADRLRATK